MTTLRVSLLSLVAIVAACGDDGTPPGATCDDGTHLSFGQCVPDSCAAGTVLVGDKCDPVLEPNHYQSPLVQLQRVQGVQSHMHVAQVKYRAADQKLFYCAYTFGMIDAKDPQNLKYVVQDKTFTTPSGSPRVPGCLHLAWDEGDPNIIYTSHRGNVDFAPFLSGYDVTSTSTPVQLPALQEPGTSYGGLDFENGLIYIGLQTEGLGVYSYDAPTKVFTRIGLATGLTDAWNVVVKGNIAYVADGKGGFSTVDVTDPTHPVAIGHLVFGGSGEDIEVSGTTVYVAAENVGVVVIDASNPAAPVLLTTIPTPGSAVGVGLDGNHLYVAAWNDTRVYDVTHPATPRFIHAVRLTTQQSYTICDTATPPVCTVDDTRPDPTARTLDVTGTGNFVFVGNWWVPYSFELHADRSAPYMSIPETFALTDFGPTEIAQTTKVAFPITNQGTAPLTIYDIYTNNAAFKTDVPQLRLQPGETKTLTLTYTAGALTMQRGIVSLYSDDPQQPIRQVYVVGNQPGLGIGKQMPEQQATLVDGSSWSSTPLIPGKVFVLAYFATF